MFDSLTRKFQDLYATLAGQKVLTEENVADAVRQVRLALLDADVNYGVVGHFIKRVKEKALGEKVLRSVKPGEQFIQLIHDELVELMGGGEAPLEIEGRPAILLLCGLQGSGKTTTCGKLGAYLQKHHKGKKILLVACDLERPAAIDQLKKLGSEVGLPVFSLEGERDPVRVAEQGLAFAKREGFDLLLVDTAGRLHVDEALMQQLVRVKEVLRPREILFVASAATGQDAVKSAAEFHQKVGITGTILTLLDGSARAGAAISIREVTQRPLKFEGVGEKMGDLQPFDPRSMADRILGRGDLINLAKKVKENFSEEADKDLEKRLKKADFTYDDYLTQMRRIKKMGSFKSLLKMIPGFSGMGEIDLSDEQFTELEAVILSMTPRERLEKDELTFSRRKRIAKGSGVPVDTVNRLVKDFGRMKKMIKSLPELKGKMLKEKMKGMKFPEL